MVQAIINGTKDLDNQAAGKEFADIAKFVKENGQLLSPQAKKTFAIYEKYATAAKAKGQTGLNASDTWRMNLEMKQLNTPFFPFTTPGRALATLGTSGPVSQPQVGAAVQNGLDSMQNTFGQFGALLPGLPASAARRSSWRSSGASLAEGVLNSVATAITDGLNNAFGNLLGIGNSQNDPLHLGEALADFKKQIARAALPQPPATPGTPKPPSGNTGIVPPWLRPPSPFFPRPTRARPPR